MMTNRSSKKQYFLPISIIGCLLSMGMTAASQISYIPVGDPILVHPTSAEHQTSSHVAIEPDGDFVVVWDSESTDGSELNIGARIFDNRTQPKASEIQSNLYTSGDQVNPVVDINTSNGNIVIAWESQQQHSASSGMDIYARLFDANGNALSDEILINTTTTDHQIDIDIATASQTGNFAVAWTHASGTHRDIYFRLFDATGKALTDETLVNPIDEANHFSPGIEMDDNGNFIVAWTTNMDTHYDIHIQRYDSTGQPIGSYIQVNSTEAGDQHNADIDINNRGDFIVVWDSLHTGKIEAYGRFFDADGNPLGDEFKVNQLTEEGNVPRVALSELGSAIVVWDTIAGTQFDVYGRLFYVDGSPITEEFLIYADSDKREVLPDVDMSPNGDYFVVVWDSIDASNTSDVYARLFANKDLPNIIDSSIENAWLYR